MPGITAHLPQGLVQNLVRQARLRNQEVNDAVADAIRAGRPVTRTSRFHFALPEGAHRMLLDRAQELGVDPGEYLRQQIQGYTDNDSAAMNRLQAQAKAALADMERHKALANQLALHVVALEAILTDAGMVPAPFKET